MQFQKRFLLNSIKELYKAFSKKTGFKISYSSFLRLKPFWVVNKSMNSRDTCLCVTHANFAYKLIKLHLLKIINVQSPTKFLRQICCDITNKDCMYRRCSVCFNKEEISFTVPENDFATFYYKWITKNVNRTDKKGRNIVVKITEKEKIYCTAKEIIELVKHDLLQFSVHCYKVWHQHTTFREITTALLENEVALLIDWSENYVCKHKEEVQSVHFGASKKQLSLHTGMIYFSEGSACKIPFCTVSESMRHDACAIWAHLIPVFSLLREEFPLKDTIHFFSDGPTTQYKNKSNFYLFCKNVKDNGFKVASWNFSEPGHGKGPADGVGGIIKRTADKAVLFGTDIIDAKSFVKAVNHLNFRTFIGEEHSIISMDEFVPSGIKSVPGTMKLRQIVWNEQENFSIGLRELSCKICRNRNTCSHSCSSKPELWNFFKSILFNEYYNLL